ncbi:MAG: hypothetical protein K9G38_01625 [Bacteroidales bacterium]|nr:hypothetical protein [Bacteroidales bacterium]
MKKIWVLVLLSSLLSGCSILSELTALSKCEFSFHSAQDPVVAGIDVMRVQSFSDLTLMDGQRVASQLLQKRLPFGITANIEVRNPGITKAALNHIEWIAFIDDVQISSGKIEQRVEILPNGGTAIVPVRIESDLFEYLEGDSPRTMLNFALNLVDAGGQPTRLSLKIKPSVVVGSTTLPYHDYFTISKEYRSGN